MVLAPCRRSCDLSVKKELYDLYGMTVVLYLSRPYGVFLIAKIAFQIKLKESIELKAVILVVMTSG